MGAAFKDELLKLAQTRLAWFIAGVVMAHGDVSQLVTALTKFAGL